MKVSAVRLQIVCIVSVDWNDNTDLLFFLAFLPCVSDLDGQGQGSGDGGEANHEDAEEAGDDGGLLQDQEYLPLQKECNLLDMRVKFMRLRSYVFIQ
jgi:hypothetical protein